VTFFFTLKDNDAFKSYTEENWKKHLTSEQYHICREKGTEPVC
jgi:peptide methionine sulfoxide reductase MsrB